MKLPDITAITYEYISSDEQLKVVKSLKSDFTLFAGFNNRTSQWFIKPQRKAVYDEITKLFFAQWNESTRFNNNCPDWFVKTICGEFFAMAFKRKLQDIELEYLIKRYRRLENAVKKLHKEANV